MTDGEAQAAFEGRVTVAVVNHEYVFEGKIVAYFEKLDGKVRVVVENSDHICLIQSPKNLLFVDERYPR